MRNVELYYQLQVHEPSGLLVADTGIRPGHSFCKQFAQLLYNVGFDCGLGTPVAITNTLGASVTLSKSMDFDTTAGSTTTTYGIQAGTGTTAESINDTALVTLIAHGTSAGTLQYGSMTYGAPSTTAT